MIPKVGVIISGWLPASKPVQAKDVESKQPDVIKVSPSIKGKLETAAVVGLILTAPVSVPLMLAFDFGFFGTKILMETGAHIINKLAEIKKSNVSTPAEAAGKGPSPTETAEPMAIGISNAIATEQKQLRAEDLIYGVSTKPTTEGIRQGPAKASSKPLSERKQLVAKQIFEEIKPSLIGDQSQIDETKKYIETEVGKLSKKSNPNHIFPAGGREYIISKVNRGEQQKTVAIEVSSKEKEAVGEGTFSQVSLLNSSLVQASSDVSIEGSKKWVVKEPRVTTERELDVSKEDMKQDVAISKMLNMNGPQPAIPSEYRLLDYGDSMREIMPMYEIGGSDFVPSEDPDTKVVTEAKLKLTADQISSVISQVTKGLKYMQKEDVGVLLRDINTSNFRMNINENGEIKIVFTDFGGTMLFKSEIAKVRADIKDGKYESSDVLFRKYANLMFRSGVSPEYVQVEVWAVFKMDIQRFYKEFDAVDTEGLSGEDLEKAKEKQDVILKNMESYITAQMKKWGQYSTGISLYEMITGEYFGEGVEFKVDDPILKPIPVPPQNIHEYVQILDKERARSVMDGKLKDKGASEEDRKTILDLVFPPPNSPEVAI